MDAWTLPEEMTDSISVTVPSGCSSTSVSAPDFFLGSEQRGDPATRLSETSLRLSRNTCIIPEGRRFAFINPSEQSPLPVNRHYDTLERLLLLPADWNGHGSETPNATAVENGRTVLDALLDLSREPTRVVPSADGGVGVYVTSGQKYTIIECSNDGEVTVGVSNRSSYRDAWDVAPNPKGIREALEEAFAFLNG